MLRKLRLVLDDGEFVKSCRLKLKIIQFYTYICKSRIRWNKVTYKSYRNVRIYMPYILLFYLALDFDWSA